MTLRPPRALLLFAALAVAVGLTGCDYFPPDPVSLTLRDGAVVARLCVEVTADHVAIKRVDGKPEETFVDSVVAGGQPVTFPAGTELVLGAAPDGLELSLDRGTFEPTRGEYNFEMYYENAPTDALRWPIDAFYDGADLRAGEWLDAYGEPQEEPCTPAPCISGAACIGQWTSEPTATPAGFSRAPAEP
ncbi:hypothetical protein ASE14_13125 [Agromyces sp. Root81]|uniref:hypothetical protein n=1 Tax=Agromyces sp. Root81 TaxID=1736601 RepID=UPI0006FEF015|nr:hypothetical protein [Agromyces sp. Root81]KRC61756.1 hypothetical protein ASE14_13125 [Agromyces sp. Root81]